MAICLALASAVLYGMGDFVGGLVAKSVSAWQVAVVVQMSSIVCTAAAAGIIGGDPQLTDIAWGALAGLGMGSGGSFLYRGLATARMSVVAPLSGVATALVPVAVGLTIEGLPSIVTFLGIICALPATVFIAMVKDIEPAHRAGIVDGVVAGCGFGLLLVGLSQVSAGAGLYPLIFSQFFAILAVVVIATILQQTWLPRHPRVWRAGWIGPLSASASTTFLYSAQHGLLAVVSAISALYPASTVLLASVLLREKLHRWQTVGLVIAAIAVSLISLG